MTQPTDTPSLQLSGQPVFELDHNVPWPIPESKPVAPQTPIDRITAPFRRWLEKMETQ